MDTRTIYGNDAANSPESKDSADFARALRAQLATVTGGLAPDMYANAWWDWYLNLSKDPPKQLEIVQDALAKTIDSWSFALRASSGQPLPPAEDDDRFGARRVGADGPSMSMLAATATTSTGGRGLGRAWRASRRRPSARWISWRATRLEAVSPANYLATNPELLDTTRAEAGENLVRGFNHWLEDVTRTFGSAQPSRRRKIRRRPRCRRHPRQSRAAQRSH